MQIRCRNRQGSDWQDDCGNTLEKATMGRNKPGIFSLAPRYFPYGKKGVILNIGLNSFQIRNDGLCGEFGCLRGVRTDRPAGILPVWVPYAPVGTSCAPEYPSDSGSSPALRFLTNRANCHALDSRVRLLLFTNSASTGGHTVYKTWKRYRVFIHDGGLSGPTQLSRSAST